MFFISSKKTRFVHEIFKFMYFRLPLFFFPSAIALQVIQEKS